MMVLIFIVLAPRAPQFKTEISESRRLAELVREANIQKIQAQAVKEEIARQRRLAEKEKSEVSSHSNEEEFKTLALEDASEVDSASTLSNSPNIGSGLTIFKQLMGGANAVDKDPDSSSSSV